MHIRVGRGWRGAMISKRTSLTLTESRMTLRGGELGSGRRPLRVRRWVENRMMQCCCVLRVLRWGNRVVLDRGLLLHLRWLLLLLLRLLLTLLGGDSRGLALLAPPLRLLRIFILVLILLLLALLFGVILLAAKATDRPRGVREGTLLEAVGVGVTIETIGDPRAWAITSILGGWLVGLLRMIRAMMGFVKFVYIIPK